MSEAYPGLPVDDRALADARAALADEDGPWCQVRDYCHLRVGHTGPCDPDSQVGRLAVHLRSALAVVDTLTAERDATQAILVQEGFGGMGATTAERLSLLVKVLHDFRDLAGAEHQAVIVARGERDKARASLDEIRMYRARLDDQESKQEKVTIPAALWAANEKALGEFMDRAGRLQKALWAEQGDPRGAASKGWEPTVNGGWIFRRVRAVGGLVRPVPDSMPRRYFCQTPGSYLMFDEMEDPEVFDGALIAMEADDKARPRSRRRGRRSGRTEVSSG